MSQGSFENINLLLCINVIIGIIITRGNSPPAIFLCDLISWISIYLDAEYPVSCTRGNEGFSVLDTLKCPEDTFQTFKSQVTLGYQLCTAHNVCTASSIGKCQVSKAGIECLVRFLACVLLWSDISWFKHKTIFQVLYLTLVHWAVLCIFCWMSKRVKTCSSSPAAL